MPKEAKPFASSIVTLDHDKARFTLPADVLRSVGWELTDDEVLVAEFVDVGHYRLHRQSNIAETINKAVARIEREAPTQAQKDAWMQTLADQYREVPFYPSDNNRVWIKPEILMALTAPAQGETATRLYIQAATTTIDVMTHSVRIAKLSSFVRGSGS